MPEPSDEVVFDVARGDVGIARQLRQSLEVIMSATSDPDLRRQLDDVLAGRASMREFGATEAFAGIMDRIPRERLNRSLALPEDERERLAARGEAELDRLRQERPAGDPDTVTQPPRQNPPPPHRIPELSRTTGRVIPGTRKPNREQIYIPDDELDDDDRYYQERRRQGWLE
jgi:hypothetical protein